ncbi:MAG: MFS transporter [Proteobacteria bacterium]|nr:MFS transporter [Pseudomonadota bacterium]
MVEERMYACADEARGRRTALSWGFKARYGAGSLTDGLVGAGLGFFLLFYLTAVCGMSGTMAGMASMIALLIDAVADPAIGLASDRLTTRWGRRLPFMVFSIVPFACAFGALFSMPENLTGGALFLYATTCLVVLRLSLSAFVLPFTAVGAEITDDYLERASVVSFRLTFQYLGVLCGVMLGLGVFLAGSNGLLLRRNYVPFAWTCALIIFAAGTVAIGAVRQGHARLHAPQAALTPFLAGLKQEVRELSGSRSFLFLFATLIAYFLAYSANVSLALYASRYFWKFDNFAIQLILISSSFGPLLGAPISAIALRYFEKRSLEIACMLIIAVFLIWPPLLQIYGPIHLSAGVATAVLIANGVFYGTALMVGGVAFQSMMADAADEHELLFGVRREGLFFSGLTLAYKAASGLGGLIAGVALDAIGFPTHLVAEGATSAIPPGVIVKLGLISGPLPAILVAIAPAFLLGYRLTRKRQEEILAALEKRRKPLGQNSQDASFAARELEQLENVEAAIPR